jgi:hypothetical protein
VNRDSDGKWHGSACNCAACFRGGVVLAGLLLALFVSMALLSGCTTIVCALWSPDGCPGTGAYNACAHKNPPAYCATPEPRPTPTEVAR